MGLLADITIVFAISVAAILICHVLRVPSTVGFLLAGIVAGPHGLRVVGAEEVELLAEIGIVLLMFVIGLEFSLSGVAAVRKPFLLGGTLQMMGTAAAVGAVTIATGTPVPQGVYLGFVVSLSSTAIVLSLLQQRAEMETPHGRTTLAMLVYQDIAVVPIMLSAPLLAGAGGGAATGGVGRLAIGILGVAVASFVLLKWVVPWLLHRIAATGVREAFLLGVLVICAAIALITHEIGLSLALGAFLAGLIISESQYSNQAVSVILPFRDVFMSLFFVSVGMLFDVRYFLERPLFMLALTAGILVAKPLVAGVSALAVGLPLRNAVFVGAAMGQIGEFSLVLAGAGVVAGLLDADVYQTVIGTAVASMMVTPLLIAGGPRVAELLGRAPLPARWKAGRLLDSGDAGDQHVSHIILVGFGVTGRNVARAAESAGVPYTAIEINADTVRTMRAEGHDIHYGDATYRAVLDHVGAARAKAVVIAVNDPAATRAITANARKAAPDAYVIVRSRYLSEAEALHALGADEVIADELEVSIEIFSRVLARFLVPREDVEHFVDETRESWRAMARSLAPTGPQPDDLRIEVPDLTTRCFRLSDRSPLSGKSIAESGLRHDHGVTVLAVRRHGEVVGNPHGAFVFEGDDVLFTFGPDKWDPAEVS